MFKLAMVIILVFIGCQTPHKIKEICKNSINSSILDFENNIKKQNYKVDSLRYLRNYPMQICGIEYFLEGKYYIRAYFDKTKCFPSSDTISKDSNLNYSISNIIFQKKGRDVQIFN